jgi:hypothetical protein
MCVTPSNGRSPDARRDIIPPGHVPKALISITS